MAPGGKKNRIVYYDLLRAAAFLGIFYYHAVAESAAAGFLSRESAVRLYQGPNLHVATTAVALFFLLSGASLMTAYGKESSFSEKTFYKGRFLRILLPYYLANAVVILRCLLGAGFPESVGRPWTIVFTAAGIDGYLAALGAGTLFMGIGEWFLGCLIFLYALFPLLRRILLRRPALLLAPAAALYVFFAFRQPLGISIYIHFLLKMFEFLLGMALAHYTEKVQRAVRWAGAAVFLVLLLLPVTIPVPEAFRITLSAVSLFLGVSLLEGPLSASSRIPAVLGVICRYSYECFLTHHLVLLLVLKLAGKSAAPGAGPMSAGGIVLIFLTSLFLTALSGVILNKASGYIRTVLQRQHP